MKPLHPMQDIERDDEGTIRFRPNAIVRFLLDAARNGWKADLNTLAEMQFSDADRMQFAQLIGYSVSGYGELSYASDESVAAADAIAAEILVRADAAPAVR